MGKQKHKSEDQHDDDGNAMKKRPAAKVAAAKAAKAASGVASLSSLPISSEKKKSKKEKPEKLQLSHDQVGEIAEAVDRMASETPVKKERLEVDALEREREAHREEIEEGKKSSAQVAMLDSRVSAMLARLRSELGEAESQIGEAFHSLDLDGDGMHASKHTSSSLPSPSSSPTLPSFHPPTNNRYCHARRAAEGDGGA